MAARMFTRTVLVPLLLLGTTQLWGQSERSAIPRSRFLHHTSWETEAGVRPGDVLDIQRSADGYLWLGTSSSLYRFDGVRFTLMDERKDSLLRVTKPGRWSVGALTQRQTIWICRPDGVLLEYKDGIFHPLLTQTGPIVNSAVEASDGVIWLERYRSLVALRGGRLIPRPVSAEVPDTNLRSIIPDTAGGFWMGTENRGLWHVTPTGATEADSLIRQFRSARPLLQSRDGTLWAWLSCLWVRRRGVWSQVDAPGKLKCIQAQAAVEGPDGSVWIGTRGRGLLRWRDGRLDAVDYRDGLSAPTVSALHADGEQSIWVGTIAGLDRLRPAPFSVLSPRDGLPFQSPRGLYEGADGGAIVEPLGTRGLFRIEGGVLSDRATNVKSTLLRSGEWGLLSTATDGGLWLTRNGDNVVRVRADGGLSVAVQLPPGTRPIQLVETSDGTPWLRLFPEGFGVVRGGRFVAVPLKEKNTAQTGRMMGGLRGTPWVAVSTTKDLLQLQAGRVLRRVPLPTGVDAILAIAPGAADTLWATYGGGLVRVVGERAVAIPLPQLATTLDNFSVAIVAQRERLFFGSERGIGRIRISDLNAIADGRAASANPYLFGRLDGLSSSAFTFLNPHPLVAARDGRLWFSTVGGIAVYDSRYDDANPVVPRVLIEEVTVDGRELPAGRAFQISPNPGRIEIHFTAPSLRVPEQVRLEYRLDGIDRDWVSSGSTRTAAYPSLSPGTYQFRVRALNEDGAPSAVEAARAVQVLPAWNQTWWFAILIFLAVSGLVGVTFIASQRVRDRLVSDRMQAGFDAILVERTRIARDLHDTLLQDFTGITLELQALSPAIRAKGSNLSEALERVLQRADGALRDARQMVWDIRAPELDAQSLTLAIETAARAAIGSLPIALNCALDGSIGPLPPAIEVALLRIAREAVCNAVKHADPSSIDVTLGFQKDAVTLTVTDDGTGIDPAAAAAATADGHWGLVGMRSRAVELGGLLNIDRGSERGTRVTLVLPIVSLRRA